MNSTVVLGGDLENIILDGTAELLNAQDGSTGAVTAIREGALPECIIIDGDANLITPIDGQNSVIEMIREGVIPYEGDYQADPLFTAQELPTMDRFMSRNFTVNAIYKTEVTNPQGGLTVYIGGEFINV